jgi:hypothetical protein
MLNWAARAQCVRPPAFLAQARAGASNLPAPLTPLAPLAAITPVLSGIYSEVFSLQSVAASVAA